MKYPLIFINGQTLDHGNGRWGIDKGQAMRTAPARRTTSVLIPGRSGTLAPAYEPMDSPTFPVTVIVFGQGSTAEERFADMTDSINTLYFMFQRQGGVDITYKVSDTDSYAARARCISIDTPDLTPGKTECTITFIMELLDPYWRSPTELEEHVSTFGTPVTLSTLSGSTAPITDVKMLARGPFTQLIVRFPHSGQQYLKVQGTVASNEYLLIDCGAYKAIRKHEEGWDLSGHADWSPRVFTGGARSEQSWLTLVPSDPITTRPVHVQVEMKNNGAGSRVTFRGRKAYL